MYLLWWRIAALGRVRKHPARRVHFQPAVLAAPERHPVRQEGFEYLSRGGGHSKDSRTRSLPSWGARGTVLPRAVGSYSQRGNGAHSQRYRHNR